MIIAALIFLGPEKIPQFLKSCGEGIVLFKETINKPISNETLKEDKKKINRNSKFNSYKKNRNKSKNKKQNNNK
jgi:Sec-independent protein translocase protein TatA